MEKWFVAHTLRKRKHEMHCPKLEDKNSSIYSCAVWNKLKAHSCKLVCYNSSEYIWLSEAFEKAIKSLPKGKYAFWKRKRALFTSKKIAGNIEKFWKLCQATWSPLWRVSIMSMVSTIWENEVYYNQSYIILCTTGHGVLPH